MGVASKRNLFLSKQHRSTKSFAVLQYFKLVLSLLKGRLLTQTEGIENPIRGRGHSGRRLGRTKGLQQCPIHRILVPNI